MSRPSEYVAPLVITALLSVAAPIAYYTLLDDSPRAPQSRRANVYLIESPMGKWTAVEKPSLHWNGMVSFRDADSGMKITIDDGGVVIRPKAASGL
jgi:hypothetical protein